MAVYRAVNNGLLYDLWNAYDLDGPPLLGRSGGGDGGLVEFVASGIEKVHERVGAGEGDGKGKEVRRRPAPRLSREGGGSA